MKKFYLMFVVILSLLIVFTACGNNSNNVNKGNNGANSTVSQGSSEAAKNNGANGATTGQSVILKGGEYVLDTQMANKNPFAVSGTWRGLFEYIYEPLLYFNPVKGELMPALASSYEWNSDYTSLTLTINDKAKWQDGQPFSIDDAIYTFEILKNNPMFDQYGIWKYIDTITNDNGKMVFKLKKPFPSLPFYISTVYIVPKHIWEKQDAKNFVNENPIGTGPFIFKKYNTGTDVEFDANKDYWRGAPQVDKLIIQIYNSAPNVTLALLNGDIQFTMGTVAMPNIPEFLTKQGAKLQTYPGLTNFSVLINCDKPLLNDPVVRKAMVMAINQKDLIAKGEYNAVFPMNIGWLPPLFKDFVNTDIIKNLAYDLGAAQKLLEGAGYTKGSDGIYQKDGKRLSFTYYNASGAPAQQMEAGMIQQWLLNLGIEIIPKLATWPELTKLAQNGQYDLLQMGVTFPPDPFASLNSSFNSSMTAPIGQPTPGINYFRFRNDGVDALLAEAENSTDVTKQKELYLQIQQKIAENIPFLPMYNVGGHIPYYDNAFTGWDENVPVYSAISLIKVKAK